MRQEPKELQIYKHFKGNTYQVVAVAEHTETGEKLVIYRPLYREGKTYARPLSMFLSEVDHKKYPEVKEKYRFTLMDGENEVFEDDPAFIEESSSPRKSSEGEGSLLNPILEKFLDAGSYEEKLDCFYDMRNSADAEMLSYVATSLDIELSSEEIDDMYNEILKCLKTMEKYECNRLRS